MISTRWMCMWMCVEVECVSFNRLHVTYPRRRVPHRCRIHFSVCVELNFRTVARGAALLLRVIKTLAAAVDVWRC